MKNFGAFYKAGQGYILPLLPNYESQPIWPEDPKLAIAKEMFKLALPAGHALPNQTKLSALIQDKILIGKLFSQAALDRQCQGRARWRPEGYRGPQAAGLRFQIHSARV